MATSEEFMCELDASVTTALERIGEASAAGEPGPDVTVQMLLVLALKNEMEATEEAALWLTTESDVQVKLALARQCGDEAKHYRLIEDRLRAMGMDTATLNPMSAGYSPMFHYLKGLETTVERLAAGQFTREALAKVRNRVFIEYCETKGDEETARLYREVIQPDEGHHHDLGRRLLPRFTQTTEQQNLARKASARTLELAEEIQEMARLKKGICRAPGC